MKEEDKLTLRKVHCKFVEILDPNYIIDFLYEHGAISGTVCLQIQQIVFRGDRARAFMCVILSIDTMSLSLLYDALKANKYEFLAEMLYHQSTNTIPKQRKAEISSDFRKELLKYRHDLKRLNHCGKHQEFEQEFYRAKDNWDKILKSGQMYEGCRAADFYFFALDAWCEYRRVIYDKNLIYSEIFSEMESIKPYMTEENVPEMMRLVRYGSAILMTDTNELDTALQYVQDAKTKFDLIHACRETGTVLYIEYNMLCQKYAMSLDPQLKKLLYVIASQAIEHFSREIESDETVFLDFKRMLLLKLSHLFLGIGMFGMYLNVVVTKEDERKADSLLRCIRENKENWTRMETRWKWSFYTARARLFGIHNEFENAIQMAKKALCYAERGKYSKEIKGSKDAIKYFEKQKIKALNSIEIKTFDRDNSRDMTLENKHADLLQKIEEDVDRSLDKVQKLESNIDQSVKQVMQHLTMLQNMQSNLRNQKDRLYSLKICIKQIEGQELG